MLGKTAPEHGTTRYATSLSTPQMLIMTNPPPHDAACSPPTPPLPRSATRRLGRLFFWAAVWLAVAAGLGLYVYPERPALVWFLLALCWACYRLRLRLRAVARFGKVPGAPSDRR